MTAATALDTPVVTVDLDIMERNIAKVQKHVASQGMAFRPHIKTHKIPDLGKLQMAAGASGITCQKIGEVEVFADAGVAQDVLLTFNILGQAKTDRLLAAAKRLQRLAVVLDNETVARGLSEAGRRHDHDVPFLIECDTGGGRNGVQTPEAAFELAKAALKLPRLRFDGLMTFPNTPTTAAYFTRALELFKAAGIPVPVVSGGGSPALATIKDFPMLTEHRAGTYIYNDVMQVKAGWVGWDDCAMRVRATVVSRPNADRAVFDCGTKVLTSDLYGMTGYGHILEYPDALILMLSEEHGVVDLVGCKRKPEVGEVVSIVPNHCCVVSNMVDEVYGVRGGKLETTWKVAARGSVR